MKISRLITAASSSVLLLPNVALAATGGGKLPWSSALSTLRDDLTGPTAFSIAVVAAFAAILAYSFSHEMSGWVKAILLVTILMSALTGIVNIAAALGITGAVFTPGDAIVTGGSF